MVFTKLKNIHYALQDLITTLLRATILWLKNVVITVGVFFAALGLIMKGGIDPDQIADYVPAYCLSKERKLDVKDGESIHD